MNEVKWKLDTDPISQSKRQKFKKIDNEIYDLINSRYKLPKGVWATISRMSDRWDGGINYLEAGKRRYYEIVVSEKLPSKEIKKVLIHEYCHLVNFIHFNPHKKNKLGHNVQFWKLCIEFGLSYKDYGFGATQAMRRAYVEIGKEYAKLKAA